MGSLALQRRNDFGPASRSCRDGNEKWQALRCLPVIVTQQTAQMLLTVNITQVSAHFLPSLNQPILQTLMISFTMIVADVGMHNPAQHVLAKENHPV